MSMAMACWSMTRTSETVLMKGGPEFCL